MTAPFGIFAAVVMGVAAGGGVAALSAPAAWVSAGLEAPAVMRAQRCALAALADRLPSP